LLSFFVPRWFFRISFSTIPNRGSCVGFDWNALLDSRNLHRMHYALQVLL
jgi:hypothetical protein